MWGFTAFVNGIDFFLRGAATIAKVAWGEESGAYKVLQSLVIVADFVATLADAVTLATLDGPAGAGIIAKLLAKPEALMGLSTLTGLDLAGDIQDFQDLVAAQASGQ